MNNRFISRFIRNVVFECGRRFVSILVHFQIVNLHPEIDLLIALEDRRLAV